MKAIIINKEGLSWEFNSVADAKLHVSKENLNNYVIIENVRVYDDRDEFDTA